MKVVLSVEALGPTLTGIGRYVSELALALPEKLGLANLEFYRNGHWIENPKTLLTEPKEKTPSAHKKSSFKIKPPRWLRQPLLNWQCHNKIFHGPNYFIPPSADKGVITIHDLSVFKFPETHPADRVAQFERQFSASVARASHLITDSKATRLEVISYLGWPDEKITAVPLGVSDTFAPQSVGTIEACLHRYGLVHGQYALCTSTLEPRKKIERLLSAYQLLPQAVRQFYPLILVGSSGWLSEALQANVERLSSQGWLKYLGFVPQSDLPSLYAGARAFVYPSVYEGFGLPVLEAMASGVPVVASRFTSLPEVTQGAALLVDPDDVDALASAIHRSLVDENWRQTAITSGLAVAQTFSWDRCADQTIKVYQSISG